MTTTFNVDNNDNNNDDINVDDSSKFIAADDNTPLGVFLVKSDSSEEKLLFRYPFVVEQRESPLIKLKQSKYALTAPTIQQTPVLQNPAAPVPPPLEKKKKTPGTPSALLPAYTELASITFDGQYDQEEITKVIGITDAAFSNLFGAVKHTLCDQKFELKVDNVRFVGHPSLLDNQRCFHVVFALKANASQDVVKCYHELSQKLAIALKSEEKRCNYFTKQSKIMVICHDEVTAEQSAASLSELQAENSFKTNNSKKPPITSPYNSILQRSKLAQNLKDVFIHLQKDGVVNIKINSWINVNFCLPQKVHRHLMASHQAPLITPANIQTCLRRLRPYHTFLLLVDVVTLLEQLPHDVSPSFVRLIRMANPLRNMLQLSAEADITLSQVFNIVAQLIYWGKATLIFPLCDANVYMLHPSAPTDISSDLVNEFGKLFRGECLLRTLSHISTGVSLSQLKDPMETTDQHKKFVNMLIWMLRKRLLMQLHTYVQFVPLSNGSPFLNQRLSICQQTQQQHPSHPTATVNHIISNSNNEKHHYHHQQQHQSFVEMDNVSPSVSPYQSESSLGVSPASTQFTDYTQFVTIRDELSFGKSSDDRLSIREQAEMLLREINLTKEEIDAVLATPAGNNLDDIREFSRLCCYFDGRHHIEDMMYYENMHRSAILTLIDKFRDVLIVWRFEDITVAKLQPYNLTLMD